MRAEKGFSNLVLVLVIVLLLSSSLVSVLVTTLLPESVASTGIPPGQGQVVGSGTDFYILVNSNVYSPLESYLERYAQDLEGEGFTVWTYSGTWSTPEDVRALLQGASGLVGALLVGDVPVAWYQNDTYGAFPIDSFYMDLDGTWIDENSDGVYDDRTGDLGPEIYIGRLKATGMGDEVSLLQNYFDKNHAYRTGTLTLPQRALIYADTVTRPDELAVTAYSSIGSIFTNRTFENDPNIISASDYLSRLREGWSLVHLIGHGNAHGHWPGFVHDNDIRATDPHAFFYNLNSCKSARYTEDNYIGGWYLFSDTYGLAVIGATSSGGTPNDIYPRLKDKRLGAAFLEHFEEHVHWKYVVILGDPTLYLPVAWSQPEASISPSYQSGPPGATLNYTVTVTNEGNFEDTFILSASDTQDWMKTAEVSTCADAYVDEVNPDNNYGGSTKLWVHESTYAVREYSYLKFDLRGEGIGAIADAYLWADYGYGADPDCDVSVWSVEDDDWLEYGITWDNKPTGGQKLDQINVGPYWNRWKVTEFVKNQMAKDEIVSLKMESETLNTGISFFSKEGGSAPYLEIIYVDVVPPVLTIPPGESRQATLTIIIPDGATHGTEDNITITAASQYDKTVSDSASCIASAIVVRDVGVFISPGSNNGPPGGTLTYTVTVTNEGNVEDTYDLAASDNAGWNPTVSPTSLTIAARSSDTATVSVTIPEGTASGTEDEITVTATSQSDPSVWGNDTCTANVIEASRVEVSISPHVKGGALGETIDYTVTVKNTGNVEDTFDLNASDTLGWGSSIWPTSFTIPPGGWVTATLRVTLAGGLSTCTWSVVTVTATGAGGGANDTCVAVDGQVIFPSADAYVAEAEPDTNYDSDPYLRVWSSFTPEETREEPPWWGSNRRILLKFSTENIPAGAVIKEAKLYLFSETTYTMPSSGRFDILACPQEDTNWLEDEVTWNTQPRYWGFENWIDYPPELIDNHSIRPIADYPYWGLHVCDVTIDIQPQGMVGWTIKYPTAGSLPSGITTEGSGSPQGIVYWSKENPDAGILSLPHLRIIYELPS